MLSEVYALKRCLFPTPDHLTEKGFSTIVSLAYNKTMLCVMSLFPFRLGGSSTDISAAFSVIHSESCQHVQSKDVCAAKAARGEDVAPVLRRMCPLLSPQQLYRLTEHHHDDWALSAHKP